MSILTDTIIEWNEIALTEKCISNPELHALTDVFDTKDIMSIVTQLPDLIKDVDKFNQMYLEYITRKLIYLDELYGEANKVAVSAFQDMLEIMDRDQAIKASIKISINFITNNEQELHNKKECHCYC